MGIYAVWTASRAPKVTYPRPSDTAGVVQEMAHTLARIHDRRVIVADMATRNFLLSADLSVKFSDFSESTLLPLHTDMQTADDSGYSIYTDSGQLGSVLFESGSTGTPCKFDLDKTNHSNRSRPEEGLSLYLAGFNH